MSDRVNDRARSIFPSIPCENPFVHEAHPFLALREVEGQAIPNRVQAWCEGRTTTEDRAVMDPPEVIKYDFALVTFVKEGVVHYQVIYKEQASELFWTTYMEDVGSRKNAALIIVKALNEAERNKS